MNPSDKLRAYWSNQEDDLMLNFPVGTETKSDGRSLAGVFSKEFTEEMTRRGYDITTLRFSIAPQKGNQKFSSQREV
jgi:hypothetical protein